MIARVEVAADDAVRLRVLAVLLQHLPPSKRAEHLEAHVRRLADRVEAALRGAP